MLNRIIKYAGSKLFLSKNINNKIIQIVKNREYVYIEPFLGSGAIFYNLTNSLINLLPKYCILNDIDSHIVQIHNYIKEHTYDEYNVLRKSVEDRFGDIEKNKNAYYSFRDWYNSVAHIHSNDGYLILLANSCINSLLRFGPNGMNASYGHCHYIIERETYEDCHKRLNSNVVLNNTTYTDIFNQLKTIDDIKLLFLDPPYASRAVMYNKNFNLREFIDNLLVLTRNVKNLCIFYTDIENTLSNELLEYDFTKEKIRDVLNVSPSKHSEKVGDEVMYFYSNI